MTLALPIMMALTMTSPGCQDRDAEDGATLEVRVREWYERTRGTMEADATGPGSRVSLSGDLDLGNWELVTELELVGHLSDTCRIYASWWRESSSGDSTLTRTIDFRGHSFTTGTPIHSSIVFDVVALTFEYAFPRISLGNAGRLEFSAQAGLRGFWADGTIRASGEEASTRGSAVTPVLGGHVAYLFRPWLRADADASGMKLSLSSENFAYVETKAELVAQPLHWLVAGVGYKYVYFHDRYSGTVTSIFDADIAGAYVMIGFRF